jgi:transposase
MQLVRRIIQLLQRGYPERSISRELKVSRTTIRRYTERFRQQQLSYSSLLALDDAHLSAIVYPPAPTPVTDPRKSGFDALAGYFISELTRTGVTRLLLWQEYRRDYPDGYEYSRFCDMLKDHMRVKNADMHFEHNPAEVVMVDFAGDKLSYVCQDTGEVTECPVLVCVLPFSGFGYAVALPNATIPQVIRGLNECLRYFNGVPFSLKTDNMKQVVAKSCRYEPVFTEALEQWSLHYNITLTAARVRKPKDKPHVENEVKLTYQRIYAPLRNRTFYSLQELNHAIEQQRQLHHARPFQKKDGNRAEFFQREEQPFLQSLPSEPYHLRHSVQAKVQKNYHITLGEDWHHYSVPFRYIGKTTQVVYDTDTVEIYYQHQRIAAHQRSYRKHAYTTSREHMPEGHLRYHEQKGWDAAYFLKQAEEIGPETRQYIEHVLQGKRFTEQTFNACRGILRLAVSHSPDRLEAACKRAMKGRSYTYRIIQNILINNLDRQEELTTELFTIPSHSNLRGAEAYR